MNLYIIKIRKELEKEIERWSRLEEENINPEMKEYYRKNRERKEEQLKRTYK